jgi:hydrogenase maturation protein HypF
MATFPMCKACQAEYENPLDRRFHAQPNACAICGPHVWVELSDSDGLLESGDGAGRVDSKLAIAEARRLLARGKILAVKGLGGFHLACSPFNEESLATLRRRKGRVDKPFAVMALDVATVRAFADVDDDEARLLESKERPILLLRKKENQLLSPLVAPGNQYIGVMLPYTPLHYLLLRDHVKENQGAESGPYLGSFPVLVMTSGNYSDEPIVKDNDEARQRLSKLADAFLFHNRDIYARCDDSVIRIVSFSNVAELDTREAESRKRILPIRRSRGYAPFPIKLPLDTEPILAVGGELKATFCLAKGAYAYMSQHIGDMENLETEQAFDEAVKHFAHIFRSQPQIVACDMHPNYLSTRWAQRQQDLPVVQVQHHHAHIAAVMAEHGLNGSSPVIGFSFDGTGYGHDGAVWGGEVLVADYKACERRYHLKYVPMVGGDAAVKRPYRLALAQMWSADVEWNERIPSVQACTREELRVLEKQLVREINTIATSSMGRLFDVAASLAGVRQVVTYEAQAAMEFEALGSLGDHGSYAFKIDENSFDASLLIAAVVKDVLAGVGQDVISARFHQSVANLVLILSNNLRETTGIDGVALSGGVFQNVMLLQKTVKQLVEAGFKVYSHRLVPPNDGGLALGQAVIAAALTDQVLGREI